MHKFTKNYLHLKAGGANIDIQFQHRCVEQHLGVLVFMDAMWDSLVPERSNGVIYAKSGKVGMSIVTHVDDPMEIDLHKEYYVVILPTEGRYDVNSSMNYNMTEAEKLQAKQLYKGKNNIEYHFTLKTDEVDTAGLGLALIASNSGTQYNLVFECPNKEWAKVLEGMEEFEKMPKWDTWYMRRRWLPIKDIITLAEKVISLKK